MDSFFSGRERWYVRLPDRLLEGESWDLDAGYGKLVFRFRSRDGQVFCRRVLGYREEGRQVLMEVTHHGSRKTDTLILAGDASGEFSLPEWHARLRGLLSLEGYRVVHQVTYSDLARHLSGRFTRLILRKGVEQQAAIAAIPGDSGGYEGMLTAGLLWLDRVRQTSRNSVGLTVCVPEPPAASFLSLAAWIRPSARLRLLSFRLDPDRVREIPVREISLDPDDEQYEWPVSQEHRLSPLLLRLLELEPRWVRRHGRGPAYDSLRFRGFEFARVYGTQRDSIHYGTGGDWTELTEKAWDDFLQFFFELLSIRRWNSTQRGHPYYRLQAERWLESLLLDDIQALGVELDPHHVCSQVPTYVGGERGLVDLLTVDHGNRLVVIELKVSEEIDLPLQGLDYWSRVYHHNLRGDFQKRGYFPGVRLSPQAPLLYLVSPLFRFHEMLDIVLQYVRDEVECYQVGINHNWRRAVRVLRRRKVHG